MRLVPHLIIVFALLLSAVHRHQAKQSHLAKSDPWNTAQSFSQSEQASQQTADVYCLACLLQRNFLSDAQDTSAVDYVPLREFIALEEFKPKPLTQKPALILADRAPPIY